jgi:hypothetical protein
MGRRRKIGPRERNGRPQRKTTRLGRAEESARMTVMRQPHRRGRDNPGDYRLAYPLGRLAAEGKITDDEHTAGFAWLLTVEAYYRLKGVPSPARTRHDRGRSLAPEPDEAIVETIERQFHEAAARLRDVGAQALCWKLIILERDQHPRCLPLIRAGLASLVEVYLKGANKPRRKSTRMAQD